MTFPHIFRASLVTVFLCRCCLPAHGQITITKADIQNATAVGTSGTGYITPYGTNPIIHIGPASATAQTWDFRGYAFDPFVTIEYVDPSAAPHLASFPQTNVVMKQWDDVTQTNIFQYNRLTDAEYLCLGTGNDSDTNLVVYDPPMPQMKTPATRGVSWTYTGLPHSPYPGITVQNSSTVTIDAFGTVQLPEGDFPALRVRNELLTDTRTATTSALRRGLAYYFFTKAMDWVYIYCDTNDIGNVDVHTTGIGYQVASHPDAIENRIPSDRTFALGNYPNPFFTRTTISFQLATSDHVTLSVYDALGRELRMLANGWHEAGTYQYAFDPAVTGPASTSGVYLYRLTTRSMSVAKTMTIVR
jgi:hypothetical protein